MQHYCYSAILLLWCFGGVHTSAQTSFEAQVESPEIVQGTRFDLVFTLKNAEGTRFTPPNFGELRPAGGVSESRGIRIENGQSSSQQNWTFSLQASRTGSFVIGAASVYANGKVLTTQPLNIRIVPPRPNGGKVRIPPGADSQLFLVSEVDRPEVYPGQQMTWRVRLYTLVGVESFDVVEIPDFEGFFHREKRRFDTRVQYQVLKGKKYAIKTLYEEAIFPEEAGALTIGQAQFRVGVERSGPMGALLGPVPVLLQAPPIVLQVKPLPQPIPQNFSGCTGHYEWEVSADKDSLDTDNALTLSLSIRGNGNAKHLAPPVLHLPTGLETFEPKTRIDESFENGQELIHKQVLDYVVLPKTPGDYAFWPEFVFFDPDSNRYRSLHLADSLRLFVAPGEHYQAPSAQNDSLLLTAPPALRQPGFFERNWVQWQSLALWGILGLLLCGLGAFLFWQKKKKNLPEKQAPPPSASAINRIPPPVETGTAKKHLAHARQLLHSEQPRAFYDALYHALQSWFSERLQLSPAHIDQSSIQQALTRYGAPTQQATALLAAWQTCEEAVFAGQAPPERMAETLQLAEKGMG